MQADEDDEPAARAPGDER
jgi:hypothetical protein